MNGSIPAALLVPYQSLSGSTPINAALHHAACEGHVDVMRVLLQHGASVHDSGTKETTPLILADASNNATALQALLHHKANADAVNAKGYVPLCLPAERAISNVRKCWCKAERMSMSPIQTIDELR